MAVQAQYPCNFPLLNRSDPVRKEIDFPQAAPGFLDPSALLFANGAAPPNPRKRGREAVGIPVAAAPQQQSHPVNCYSLQPQPCSTLLPPPTLVSLSQLHGHPAPLVSTGLRLFVKEQHQQQSEMHSNPLLSSSSSSPLLSSHFSQELAARINQQKDEIEQFVYAQEEQLRRTLGERQRRHYRYLLSAARQSAARRLQEKEADVERAARRSAELEEGLARLRTESMAWQAKAMADEAAAASLHAQLQQAASAAAARPPAKWGESAEDAESAFVDPDRVEPEHACRACRGRSASVVLLPCRHLCLCDACDGGGAAAESCPVCRCVRTGSVRVLLA